MSDTAQRLRRLMADRQITQKRLAVVAGCSDAAINKILKGGTRRSRLLAPISAALGVSLDWLHGTADPPEESVQPRSSILPSEHRLRQIFYEMLEELPEKLQTSRLSSALARELPARLIPVKPSVYRASSATAIPEHGSGMASHKTEGPETDGSKSAEVSRTDLARRLAQSMSVRGISQRGLAQKIGCSQVTISKILSGDIRTSRYLPEIARELGVDSLWLQGSPVFRSDDNILMTEIVLLPDKRLDIILYNILSQASATDNEDLAVVLARELLAILAAPGAEA